mgnify:CR=1 FL=1
MMDKPARSWAEAFAVYSHPRVLGMLFLGFAAGLPYLLVFSTLSAWLRDMDVSRSAIGFFSWVGITYSIKVLWAPVVDRLPIWGLTRRLGQRRSWMLLGQLGIVAGLLGMIHTDPQTHLAVLAAFAVLVAFSSATQDVAIDAYRIEAVVVEYQGAMSATYILGYRLAMLMAGAGALYLADIFSWRESYLILAALMGVGMITVLLIAEPDHTHPRGTDELEDALVHKVVSDGNRGRWARLAAWFTAAVVSPFVEFFQRNGRFALLILLFIAFYRVSDITMGIMANPFYLDLGFSKSEIASIGKLFGFIMTIAGSFLGGLLVVRYGVFKPLFAGAVAVALTNLLFAQLALTGPDINWLVLVISADNLSGGFSQTAFFAYLSGLTNRAYTATQYALFSSLMTLPGKVTSGFSGMIVDAYDYQTFFIYAALMGLPAICLAVFVVRRGAEGLMSGSR